MRSLAGISFGIILAGLSAAPAFAHVGHLGEVAGHSHWIGLGALIVAGAIAAVVGKLASKDEDEEADEAETAEEAV